MTRAIPRSRMPEKGKSRHKGFKYTKLDSINEDELYPKSHAEHLETKTTCKSVFTRIVRTPRVLLRRLWFTVKSWELQYWELTIIFGVVFFLLYLFLYYETMHFHVARAYAWAGYDVAQHKVGLHYLDGKGVEKHPHKAMEYFKLAAAQGHPEASHNLALGHVGGYHELQPGEARRLFEHAASNGVAQSITALETFCDKKNMCND